MSAENPLEEARIKAFLAPLGKIRPATRAPRPPIKLRRLVPLALGLTGVATAGAIAATQSGPLHDVTAQPDPSPLTCSGIIGQPPQEAQAYLEGHGYKISWRYETFSSESVQEPSGSQPGAVSGYSQEVASPPGDSIVSDVLPFNSPDRVIVFTQGKDDPNAPTVLPPDCGG
jgi:hypothetical protein